MKPSRYNFFFDADDGTHLGFNAMTGAFGTLTDQNRRWADEILESPDDFVCDSQEKQDLKDKMTQGGFILADEFDEVGLMKIRYWASRFNRKELKLTILPTLRCNFDCVYCYEARKNLDMSDELQEGLVHFIRQKTRNTEGLTINWYGGEPLMVLDKITWMHDRMVEACEANGCEYRKGGIITNGYLLDRETGIKLRDLDVKTVQITLDGPRDVHDQRRPLANGKGTFDRIIGNLVDVADLFKHISVRVNTDKSNADRVAEVFDTLEENGLKGRVSVYFAKVMAHTQACADMADTCFADREYTDLEVDLARVGLEKGFDPSNYPRTKANYCEADQVNSFVVDPEGYLYKCWSEPGNKDEAVGHVSEEAKYREKSKNAYKWLALDVFDRQECLECNLLPVCMGGCPYVWLKQGSSTKGICESWRYHLLDMLKVYYAAVARNKAAQAAEASKTK
jgi:uncharacterized protein